MKDMNSQTDITGFVDISKLICIQSILQVEMLLASMCLCHIVTHCEDIENN